jgi:hypothetical protein
MSLSFGFKLPLQVLTDSPWTSIFYKIGLCLNFEYPTFHLTMMCDEYFNTPVVSSVLGTVNENPPSSVFTVS